MAAVAAIGPILIVLMTVVPAIMGYGALIGLGQAMLMLVVPLPLACALSMPYGWGSLGSEQSPIPIKAPTVWRFPLHTCALMLSVSWWLIAALWFLPLSSASAVILVLIGVLGASASAYMHLNWLADIGLAVGDEGPHRVVLVCVSIGVLGAVVAPIVALFAASWGPLLIALATLFVAVIIAEILSPLLLARDMVSTLIASYEELGRETRRAERAAEHGPKVPR